jgi:hypothetical protein
MAKKFIDYDGPTGLFVATKDGIKPIQDPAALTALADSAMLSSLGYSDRAAHYTALIAADSRQPVFG